jgi:catechol 2,3-dioxygenase-like lactoylglutathione lyase family enzyme
MEKNSKIKRMDNVGIVVDDLAAAIAFFTELGLEQEGQATVTGPWVDKIVGLKGVKSDIVMMRVPGGGGRLELSKFHTPEVERTRLKHAPMNTLGMHRLMFAVVDLEDTVARLKLHGAELIGEVVRYENLYLLCYLRGPSGIIVALAQELF